MISSVSNNSASQSSFWNYSILAKSRGRPPVPDDEKKATQTLFFSNADEKAAYIESAERSGVKVSAWIRDTLNREVARLTKKKKKAGEP